ncbi:hypothetical protein [Skermanella stibiiresistens]|uniref:hypothetical protein n=1 Tax=Skermanella stibiiresistens TaxID=913326 RepID=UPI0012F726D7|nr:hypothetical protein [Skermanella stibiiresistens]
MSESVFRHIIEYPDNDGITLSDIAATLVAHERMLPIVASILERSIDGLKIEKIDITIEKIQKGSLSEAFFVAIFAVFQKELDKEVPEVIERITGFSIDERYDTIVTVLFLIVLFYGSRLLFSRRGKSEDGSKLTSTPFNGVPPAIEGNYNNYINIAAQNLSVSPKRIEEAVEQAVGKKSKGSVAKAAIDIFRPAKRGLSGRIMPTGLPEIGRDVTRSFPDEIALAEFDDDSDVQHFPEATLEIRATDRDKVDRGWAGKLSHHGMSTKRLTVRLYPTVDRDVLAATDAAQVEAILEFKQDSNGQSKPVCIHVLKLLHP